jgi:hypothetical protein
MGYVHYTTLHGLRYCYSFQQLDSQDLYTLAGVVFMTVILQSPITRV